MPHENRRVETAQPSSLAIQNHGSSGVSMPAVRPLQKTSAGRESEDEPAAQETALKTFPMPAGHSITQTVSSAVGPFQLRADSVKRISHEREISHPLLSFGAVRNGGADTVQRFADDTNKARRVAAEKESGENMQLDHAIAQDTLGKFDGVIMTLMNLPKALKPKGLQTCLDLLNKIFEGQGITLQGLNALLNIRNNLTPGYKNTVGNPGNMFDHQVEVHGPVVSISEQSMHLERIDRAIRSLNRLEPIMVELPNLEEEEATIPLLEIGADLTEICQSLVFLKGDESTIPDFDEDAWYSHGDKMVKKVPAEYLGKGDGRAAGLGSNKTLANVDVSGVDIETTMPLSSYKVTSNGKSGRKNKTNLKIDHRSMTIHLIIPTVAWKHIYNRHTLEGFAGEVKAVNTFWKEDPREVLFDYFDNVLAEILLIIDRQMDLKSELDGLVEGTNFVEPINESGTNFFFQGKYEGTPGYNLTINLESFAPQSPQFAYAILPTDFVVPPVPQPPGNQNVAV